MMYRGYNIRNKKLYIDDTEIKKLPCFGIIILRDILLNALNDKISPTQATEVANFMVRNFDMEYNCDKFNTRLD